MEDAEEQRPRTYEERSHGTPTEPKRQGGRPTEEELERQRRNQARRAAGLA